MQFSGDNIFFYFTLGGKPFDQRIFRNKSIGSVLGKNPIAN